MVNKKVTRKRVNEPIVDRALKDIYDELDKLQPITNQYTNLREEVDGMLSVTNSNGPTTMSATVNLGGTTYVDINSNFQPVGTRNYIATEGTLGRSKRPVKGESVKYNDNRIAQIISANGSDKVLLKNKGGLLNVRNANDTADADIRVANIKDANDKKSIEIVATSSATDHLKIENAASGAAVGVHLSPEGDDDNIAISMSSKGAGSMIFRTPGSGNISFKDEAGAIPMQIGTTARKMLFSTSGLHLGMLQSDTANLFKIWTSDSLESTDIAINAIRDIYLAAKGGEIYLNKGNSTTGVGGGYDIGTNFGYFDFATSSTLKLKSASNYHLQLEAQGTGVLILAGAQGINLIPTGNFDVLIDKNTNVTATGTQKGLHIDYDHTGISASGQTVTGIGLDLDMNCNGITHVGTINQTGIDIDMLAATSGTQTNTGMDIKCTGANNNYGMNITVPDVAGDYHIKLMAADDAADDYATFAVADTGVLTIATVGDGGGNSQMILDADGDIELNADGGEVFFKDGTYTFGTIKNLLNQGALYLYPSADASDFFLLSSGVNGAATITTSASPDVTTATLTIQSGGNFSVNSGGDIILDADSGNFTWVYKITGRFDQL
jgi:hypothetical protein